MANENHIVVIGNLADDPELRFNNGTPVASVRVAVTPRLQEGGIWRDGDTSFFRVSLEGSGQPPQRVAPQGRSSPGGGPAAAALLGDPDGERRSVAEIEAEDVGASLKWATVSVERATTRSGE